MSERDTEEVCPRGVWKSSVQGVIEEVCPRGAYIGGCPRGMTGGGFEVICPRGIWDMKEVCLRSI